MRSSRLGNILGLYSESRNSRLLLSALTKPARSETP